MNHPSLPLAEKDPAQGDVTVCFAPKGNRRNIIKALLLSSGTITLKFLDAKITITPKPE